MIEVKFPYKSHDNKHLWDYMTLSCSQLNNINLSRTLSDIKNSYDNVMFVVINFKTNRVSFLVSLSHIAKDKESYESYLDIWTDLKNAEIITDEDVSNLDLGLYCFDIKKYNFVLSFAEDYKNRDYIKFFVDAKMDKLYYNISDTNCVDLSPFALTQDDIISIKESYERFNDSKVDNANVIFDVDSVDGNSFLLPYMAYKDFLNFTAYSVFNTSYVVRENNKLYFENLLLNNEDTGYDFQSKIILREDKFHFNCDENIKQVPPGLWQLLVMLQHIKYWCSLHYKDNNTATIVFNEKLPETSTIYHLFNSRLKHEHKDIDLSNYQLVGVHKASELFRINKLYSNANRICHFDYSTQQFIGNGYIFNDDKLESKAIDLDNKINAELPLKMTFTELKHYIGSDLSQKSYILKVYTDGIRVMLERFDDEEHKILSCMLIFNKAMSKKNQNLTI